MASSNNEFKLVDNAAEDLNCSICLSLLKQAVEITSCGHVFCKTCLEKLITSTKLKGAQLTCPLCNGKFQEKELHPMRQIDRLIGNSVIVFCKQHMDGCPWSGVISNYEDHERMCDFKDVICNFDGCAVSVIRKLVKGHQLECLYRYVECQYCKENVVFHTLQLHYMTCTDNPVECPNKKCTKKPARKEIQEHLNNECDYQEVDCPYHNIGCLEKLQRKDLLNHNIYYHQNHTQLMFQQFQTMQTQFEKLENSFEEKCKDLKTASDKIVDLKNENSLARKRIKLLEDKTTASQSKIDSLENELAVAMLPLNARNEQLFIEGFQFYFENRVGDPELQYEEWYERMCKNTSDYALLKFSKYMFIKVLIPIGNRKDRVKWWSVNEKQLEAQRCEGTVFFNNKNFVLRMYGFTNISAATLDNWKHDKTRVFLIHPVLKDKAIELGKWENMEMLNSWITHQDKPVTNDFYHRDQLIICCQKIL